MKATIDELKKYLVAQGETAEIQSDTGQVFFVFKEKEREFPMFFRFFKESELLQLITFFPYQVKSEVASDMARLLHLLNKEIDIPGFGFDEIGGVAFYRNMIPLFQGEVSETLLNKYTDASKSACKTFGPTIEAVVVGATTVDKLINKAQAAVKNKES